MSDQSDHPSFKKQRLDEPNNETEDKIDVNSDPEDSTTAPAAASSADTTDSPPDDQCKSDNIYWEEDNCMKRILNPISLNQVSTGLLPSNTGSDSAPSAGRGSDESGEPTDRAMSDQSDHPSFKKQRLDEPNREAEGKINVNSDPEDSTTAPVAASSADTTDSPPDDLCKSVNMYREDDNCMK
jgi:predicted HicB family RNase H-like nuclease